MRRTLHLALILLIIVIPLYASMNDGQALAKVRKAYGLNAGLASNRFGVDSNWNRLIQLKTPKCSADNADLGIGFNTWETAFADLDARIAAKTFVIQGPYKGTISFSGRFGLVGVATAMTLYIDGNPSALTGQDTSALPWLTVTTDVDTTKLGFGLHAACLVSSDASGTTTQRAPVVFMVDQNS